MNRMELQAVLEPERVRPQAYDLTGDRVNEAFVIRQEPFGWNVFYRERGVERDTHTFGTEAEACDHLLDMLRRDPTTRQ